MADTQGATQSGVPGTGSDAASATPATPQRSARDEAMDAIFGARLDGFEVESGTKVDRDTLQSVKASDDDVDPDDTAANEARKQLEAQAAAAAVTETPKEGDTKLDPDAQIAAQAEGDELILDAATLAKAKVRVKVEGQEELVSASKVLGQYQKNAAADVRLADATRLQREAQTKYDESVAKAGTAATKTEKVEAQQEVTRAADALDGFKKASAALYEGDADLASKLFADAVETAMVGKSGRVQENATPKLDADAVVEAVEQRLTQRSALTKLFEDYPEIKADHDYASITDKYVNLYVQQGKGLAEAIAEAGETVGEKFKLGKHKTSAGRPIRTEAPTTRETKAAGKTDLDEVNASNVRASETAAADPTAVDIIAEIRKSRGQAI